MIFGYLVHNNRKIYQQESHVVFMSKCMPVLGELSPHSKSYHEWSD